MLPACFQCCRCLNPLPLLPKHGAALVANRAAGRCSRHHPLSLRPGSGCTGKETGAPPLVPPNRSMLQGGELLQCMQRQGAAALQQCPQPAAGAAEAWMPSGAAAAGRYRLGVAYEDSHLACVVKPPGIPTDTPPHRGAARGANNATGSAATGASQPGAGAASGASSSSAAAQAVPSVYELLAAQLQPTGELGALRRPRHVHRLDEPTGGLVVVAKTRLAQTQLSAAFMQRRVSGSAGWLVAAAPVLASSLATLAGIPSSVAPT